jgi:probable rRNA maturation factor
MSSRAETKRNRPAATPTAEADVQISAQAGGTYVRSFRAGLRKAIGLIDTKLRSVSVALVGDALMSKLHMQFMGIAGPTDVLTFELEHDRRGKVVEGEVVVCVPEARRRAREHGTRVEHELLLYAIHGLLHLSGYDDLTEADYLAIHREEDRILTALGVGPVFAPKPTPTPQESASKPRTTAPKARRKKDGRSR